MRALLERGPVTASMIVHADFIIYWTGVYSHRIGPALGGHAVKIIGWGRFVVGDGRPVSTILYTVCVLQLFIP